MIYIAVLCNWKITAEPLYNTPLFIGPYAAANNTALLAWRPSQGTKLYCLVNRGTLGVNNLPRVVARIMPRSKSNPRPLDYESNALPLHHRVTSLSNVFSSFYFDNSIVGITFLVTRPTICVSPCRCIRNNFDETTHKVETDEYKSQNTINI